MASVEMATQQLDLAKLLVEFVDAFRERDVPQPYPLLNLVSVGNRLLGAA